jgi:hypothetical protein
MVGGSGVGTIELGMNMALGIACVSALFFFIYNRKSKQRL